MSAINFVVRDGAGAMDSGALGGAGAGSILVGAGQDISLNLQRSSVISYMRNGQALQITLVDGQVLTIEGFFSADGIAENRLFLSASGQLAEVELLPGDGNLLLAQYADADDFGKWSPDDALYFTDNGALDIAGVTSGDDVGMLGAPLMAGLGGLGGVGAAGAAAVGAAALLAGASGGTVGSDGEGTDPAVPADPTDPTNPTDPADPTDPTDPVDPIDPPVVAITGGVKSAGHVVNATDHSDGIDISGTGTPGATGTLTVGGATVEIDVDDSGNWTAFVPQIDVPDGEYETEVSVTLTNAGGGTSTTDTLVVDTFTTVTFDASTVETDGIVNFTEESDGFTLSGTTQAGSSVEVSFGGASYAATVTGTTWSLDVPAGVVSQGEYDLDISVTATDAYGNTASTSDTLHIDTVTDLTLDTSAAGGDGTVNAAEHPDGVVVNGLAEANATVVVTMGSFSHTVQADGAGQWSATFAASEVPTGTLDMPVSAISTDAAGNTASASGTVTIDTEIDVSVDTSGADGNAAVTANVGDGVVNMVESANGVILSGTAEPGSTVSVSFLSTNRVFTAGSDGTWSREYDASVLPSGDLEVGIPVTVTATDAAGNTATDSGIVSLDTYVNTLTNATETVEGDDFVNAAEAADGLSFNGTVEAGSTVMVAFEGTTRMATVDASGNWSVDFAGSEVPQGTYDSSVTITATDAAGNTAIISDTFTVDTEVPDAPNTEGYFEDSLGTSELAIADDTDGTVSVHQFVEGSDSAQEIGFVEGAGRPGQTRLYFDAGDEVPDGSQIVVTDTDTAGNSNSTLFVVDDIAGSTVDVTAGALDSFNVGAIDLEFAEESQITLSAADLEAMSSNDNILVIHGGSDDAITLTDSASAQGQTVIDGRIYDVYDVGVDGAQLVIDQDIQFSHGSVV